MNDLAARVETLTTQNKNQFEMLKTDLTTLQASISHFESHANTASNSREPTLPPVLIEIPTDPFVVDLHDTPHISHSVEDFIPEQDCSKLFSELLSLPYSDEKGRQTIKFGKVTCTTGLEVNLPWISPHVSRESLIN